MFAKKYKKALTFSFDDGVADDVRLVALFNKYGIKSTFNLNSGYLSDLSPWVFRDTKEVHHLNITEHLHLYDGHEVASHAVIHPHLEKYPYITQYNELYLDKKYIEALFGHEIKGAALPYGTFNDDTVKAYRNLGFVYTRTTRQTFDFRLPDSLPLLDPTCHYLDSQVFELADKFLADTSNEDKLFYIWGHSYELVTEDDWARIERLCEKLAGHSDVYYCTNIEAIENHE